MPRIAAADLGCAVALGILYSPGLVGLTPTAASPVTSALAIVTAPTLVALAAWYNVRAVRDARAEAEAPMLDVTSDGMDPAEVTRRLRAYSHDPYVGKAAGEIADTVADATDRHASYARLVGERFGSGTTASHFRQTAELACQTIVKNAAFAANLISSCDIRALDETMATASYPGTSDADTRRHALYKGVIDKLGSVLKANEDLLVRIEEAQVSLVSLDDTDDETDEVISELDKRAHELRYYDD